MKQKQLKEISVGVLSDLHVNIMIRSQTLGMMIPAVDVTLKMISHNSMHLTIITTDFVALY